MVHSLHLTVTQRFCLIPNIQNRMEPAIKVCVIIGPLIITLPGAYPLLLSAFRCLRQSAFRSSRPSGSTLNYRQSTAAQGPLSLPLREAFQRLGLALCRGRRQGRSLGRRPEGAQQEGMPVAAIAGTSIGAGVRRPPGRRVPTRQIEKIYLGKRLERYLNDTLPGHS